MKISSLSFSIILLLSVKTYAQNFEGEIIYKNTFRSKIPNLSNEQLGQYIGNTQEYYIKGGDYKSITNGQALSVQLYNYVDNRIYNKTRKSDTLYWINALVNADTLLSFDLEKKAGAVLGYSCDALVLKTKTGTTTMYFSDRFKVDSDKFKKHFFGNWAFYTQKANALPLKIVVENAQFKMESTAIEIKPMRLDQNIFKIDSSAPIKESFD